MKKNYGIALAVCALMAPGIANAEAKMGGSVIIGYGEVSGGASDGYGIANFTLSDTYKFDSGNSLSFDLRARARTDQNQISQVDDNNIDVKVELDLGSAGKIGLTTFNDYGGYPWADGDLYNRGSVGVFPVLRKRYDGVADSQFNAARQKVDPDVLLTYSNRFGRLGLDIIANPLKSWDGNDESQMLAAFPTIEGKLTLPTDYGIYSFAYNDLEDAEVQVVLPLPKAGVTVIAKRTIEMGDWSDYLNNLAVIYRAKNMGAFKGFFLAHAFDSGGNTRSALSLNFAHGKWNAKIAGDTDGDVAIEGAYNFTENASLQFGWDNGHDMMEGFDDAVFPAPVFAPARNSAFEIAYVQKF